MELIGSLYSFACTFSYLLLILLYLLLSPLCIISSSLYEWALQLAIDIDEQTLLLILILLAVWATSAFFILDLIRGRTVKSLFFYEFVFYLTAFNFILIGVTYSLLRRENLLEEVLAKIFTTLLMIYVAEKMKMRGSRQSTPTECTICFGTNDSSEIVLACAHRFH
jgi:hypothetical protein